MDLDEAGLQWASCGALPICSLDLAGPLGDTQGNPSGWQGGTQRDMKRNLKFILIGPVLLAVASAVLLAAPRKKGRPPAGTGQSRIEQTSLDDVLTSQTRPSIVWTADHITATVTPGESARQVQVTATFRSKIPPTTVSVVPALSPYVSVTPQSLPAMNAGSQQTFTLSFSAPSGTTLGTIEGTVHLRAGTSTIARPLPITLNVWPSITGDEVAFAYPPEWEKQVLVATSEEFALLAITSPLGSRVVILKEGGLGHDFPPDVAFTESEVALELGPAVRVDYKDTTGTIFIVSVRFTPPLQVAPELDIEFRPKTGDPTAEVVFEQVLQTLRVE